MKQLRSRSILFLFLGCLFLKFLFFDLIWASSTTFSSFSFPQTYLTKLFWAALLSLPLLFFRSRFYCAIVALLVDALLISNLMYFRTYFTAIPWDSYFIAGNLVDFADSVVSSLRWYDIIFPLSSILFFILIHRQNLNVSLKSNIKPNLSLLAGCLAAPAVILCAIIAYYGGYKQAYEYLMFDFSTCGAPVYSIPGTLFYERIQDKTEYTPVVDKEIKAWLKKQPSRKPLPFKIEARDNCIIILAESFESFVLEKTVEGKEITPFLNRFLKEDNVLYAPFVQSQVGGARSIDGQLLLHTGLLPIKFGAYSTRFPHHTYYSIDKAFKAMHSDGVTRALTVDKKVVWNIAMVAQDFGYDMLLDKPFFTLDEITGPRKRLGDVSFLRQCGEKMMDENIFKTGGHTFIQCATYSGHGPFIIPEKSKRIHFSKDIPELLKNYIEVANYTDYAIGRFVEFIRSKRKFDNTMIVITGDHEGFGASRREIYANPVGHDIISPQRFTPFIVLNSPVALRYTKVMGQVDMYPTLLDLIGAHNYPWRGLGQSILAPDKPGFAISPQMEVIGDTVGISPDVIKLAKDAYSISDLIICCDYFAKTKLPN